MGREIGFWIGEVSAGSIGWSMSHGYTGARRMSARLIHENVTIFI